MPKAIFIYMNWQKCYHHNWIPWTRNEGEVKFNLFPCKIALFFPYKEYFNVGINLQASEVKIQLIIALKLLTIIALATIIDQITWPLNKPAYNHRSSNSSSFTFSLFTIVCKRFCLSSEYWKELAVSRSAELHENVHILVILLSQRCLHLSYGNGFQWRLFPLFWIPELSPCFSHNNFQVINPQYHIPTPDWISICH
jgi:hypothetical protein